MEGRGGGWSGFVARMGVRGQDVLFAGLEGKDDGHCALDLVAKRARRVVGVDMARWKILFLLFSSFLTCVDAVCGQGRTG